MTDAAAAPAQGEDFALRGEEDLTDEEKTVLEEVNSGEFKLENELKASPSGEMLDNTNVMINWLGSIVSHLRITQALHIKMIRGHAVRNKCSTCVHEMLTKTSKLCPAHENPPEEKKD